MKWLLIQPAYQYNVALPLSLAQTATYLKTCLQEEVLCFDLNLQPFDSVIATIRRDGFVPDIIGFSCTSITKKIVISLCQRSKEIFPEAKTIIGGASAKYEYPELLNKQGIDFCYISDIECIGTTFQGPLTQNDILEFPGIAFIENNKVVTKDFEVLANLDNYPFPCRDLNYIHINNYQPPGQMGKTKAATLITTRGCPHRCTYCASSSGFSGNRVLLRSAEKVIKELNYLREMDYNNFIFEDYEFLVNLPRAQKICSDLKNAGNRWVLKTRVENIDTEMTDVLAESGCEIVYIGVETLTRKAIESAKKTTVNVENVKKAVSLLKSKNIRICASTQYGLPEDTEDDFIDGTICFLARILDHKCDMVQLHFTTLFPGTELYDRYNNNASPVSLHQDYDHVIAHGFEGNLMPHLNETVIRRVYEKSRSILGNLLTEKAIWYS